MDLFRELDAMDAIRLSGTDASGWYIQEAKQAMEEGRMTYAGKYSAPDYELILASGCDLAVESTMIITPGGQRATGETGHSGAGGALQL